MTYRNDSSGRRVEVVFALCGAALVFLCAVALCAPMAGCARTGRAIGNLIESVGADFSMTVDRLAGPEKAQAVASKGGGE